MQNLKGTYSKGRREKLERKDESRKKIYMFLQLCAFGQGARQYLNKDIPCLTFL